MGYGRLTGWTGLIRPFFDRPDIEIPVVWYAVPWSNGVGPVTTFPDRFYDAREHWLPPGVGTVPGSLRPYFGALPPQDLGPLIGTPDQWVNGLGYADYLASGGSPATPCWTIVTDCPQCPDGVSADLYLFSAGWGAGGPSCAGFNGTFHLRYQGSCTWNSDQFTPPGFTDGPYYWTLSYFPGDLHLDLIRLGGAPTAGVWDAFGWDCRSDVWLANSGGGTGPCAPPAVILISPSPSGGPDVPPPGSFLIHGGTTPPPGYVAADGADYPTTAPYNLLYAVYGNRWDTFRGQTAPGTGRFRVPLWTGLVFGAAGPAVAAVGPFPATSAHAVGDVAGEEAHALVGLEGPVHTHPITDAGHVHGISDAGHVHAGFGNNRIVTEDITGGESTGGPSGISRQPTTDTAVTGVSVNSAVTGITATDAAGGGAPHNTIQPTGYVLVCVKL
jgi:hypothetical protein